MILIYSMQVRGSHSERKEISDNIISLIDTEESA